MPQIVEYEQVLETLATQGLEPAYPNGGAFHVPNGRIVGYINGEDASIRPGLDVRRTHDLTGRLLDLWQRVGGRLWLTPAHHWAHELHHGGNGQAVLDAAGLTLGLPDNLAHAVEFDDADTFRPVLTVLFVESDWHATFPDAATPATAMLHHHGQLWITTNEPRSDHSTTRR
ncbi:MAG: hypothetical protein AAGD32_11165 [Planctomycetota bacterium]